MNTIFRKSVFTTALILTSSIFINCDKTSTIKEKEATVVVAETSIDYSVKEEIITRKPVVFITGYDKGNENFYKNARAFFKEKDFEIVEEKYSLEEIINWLNNNESENSYGEIHIVNKSNPFKGMTLEM